MGNYWLVGFSFLLGVFLIIILVTSLVTTPWQVSLMIAIVIALVISIPLGIGWAIEKIFSRIDNIRNCEEEAFEEYLNGFQTPTSTIYGIYSDGGDFLNR